MQRREAFAAAIRLALGQVRIEGKPDIQEICVAGDYAFCRNQLSLTVTPLQGGPAQRRVGPTLSVFRKEPDGAKRIRGSLGQHQPWQGRVRA
jgi:ketosteroid isomerase-like protein